MTQEAFFGFVGRPFQASPQRENFVPLESMVEAVELLRDAAAKGDGVAVLTAAPGAGKTTVCLQLQTRLEPEFATILLPDCRCPTRRSLLQSILHSLGQEYAGLAEQELRLRLLDAVQSLRADRAGLVLIADEAHQLGPRLLEELRCLTNHVDRGQPLIRVLLSGQLSLEEQLTKPELHSLNYRITCHASLEPLTMRESARYIDGRLSRAGGDARSLFTENALEMICRISDGNPRALNQLADACLTHAAETGEFTIGVSMVRLVLQDLKQLPIQWNESACDQLADFDRSGRGLTEADEDSEVIDAEFDDSHCKMNRPERAGEDSKEATPTAIGPTWSNQVVSFEIGASAERADETAAAIETTEDVEKSDLPTSDDGIGSITTESELTENGGSIPISSRVDRMEGRRRLDDAARESLDLDTDSPLTTVVLRPPSDRTGGKMNDLQEILVHDRYAALDRDSKGRESESIAAAIDWTIKARIAAPQVNARDAQCQSPEEPDGPETREGRQGEFLASMLDDSLDGRINRMIQAVSDAVAHEISGHQPSAPQADRSDADAPTYRLQLQKSQWRATPGPSAFDVIEPEWDREAGNATKVLMLAQEDAEQPPRGFREPVTTSDAEAAAIPAGSHEPQVVHADSPETGVERPYARLFSRARRARSHS